MTMTTIPTPPEEAPRLAFARALATAELDAGTSGLPDWVMALRRMARERYAKLGLPTRRHEEWRYTTLRPLNETTFVLEADAVSGDTTPEEAEAPARDDAVATGEPVVAPASVPSPLHGAARDARDLARLAPWVSPADVAIVFVDGVLSTAMTRVPGLGAGVTVSTLGAAFSDRLDAGSFDGETGTDDPFLALNLAFLGRVGAYIDIAAHADPGRTIHLVHMSSTPRVAFVPAAHRDAGPGRARQHRRVGRRRRRRALFRRLGHRSRRR